MRKYIVRVTTENDELEFVPEDDRRALGIFTFDTAVRRGVGVGIVVDADTPEKARVVVDTMLMGYKYEFDTVVTFDDERDAAILFRENEYLTRKYIFGILVLPKRADRNRRHVGCGNTRPLASNPRYPLRADAQID